MIPFGNGVTVCVGRMDQCIYPVAALLEYLVKRGTGPGPLFLFRDGTSFEAEAGIPGKPSISATWD